MAGAGDYARTWEDQLQKFAQYKLRMDTNERE
jgi:hypothetical protein